MISVIIPAWNAAGCLPEAIASVWAQRHDGLELCIVDDGSTDATASVASEQAPAAILVRQPNQGPAAARNAGLRATHGDRIAFLDADDTWPAGRLAILDRVLTESPDLGMVIGRTQLLTGTAWSPTGEPWHAPLFGSALIRRSVFEQVGWLDPAAQPAEDLDWFIRAREEDVPAAWIPDVTLEYRYHGGSLTGGADPRSRNMLAVLKHAIDRRRARTR
jgi:glycosyltransferase involved in cell wall biosynthesis